MNALQKCFGEVYIGRTILRKENIINKVYAYSSGKKVSEQRQESLSVGLCNSVAKHPSEAESRT